MAEYYREYVSVVYTQTHVPTRSGFNSPSFTQQHEVEASLRDIFTRVSLEYLEMTKRRRGNQRLEDRIQSVELRISAEEVRYLLCLSKGETASCFLPQLNSAVHKETLKLLDTMVRAVKSACSDEKLCAGFICDANMLFEAIMEEVRERIKDAQGVVDEFFRDAQLQFFEDLMSIREVRGALVRAQQQWPVISTILSELQSEADPSELQVSYSTSDLLQQMSIEQVMTYINSDDPSQSRKRKKRRKPKKKPTLESEPSSDLSKMSENEFTALASAFQDRLEHCELKSRRGCPRVSAAWVERLLTMRGQLQAE